MSQDLLRIIDSICRDKAIERESFVADLEVAMASAIRKAYEAEPEVPVTVRFDPLAGNFSAAMEGRNISVTELGRIAAQTAKQVIIQKTRERERVSIFEEFTERRGTVISGTVTRAERGNLIVNLGRAEGFLPRSEQIPGEAHQVGGRIRILILEVREQPAQVKIILSRSHPEFILRLFEVEVPEVAERVIEIKALAREAGYRTKVAVASIDSKVDAVGACVGVRGSRIKNIVEELGGEKIDIVRWNESSQILIQNALKPAEVTEIALCFELGKATVVVAEDQLSLAIGKRGQNVRLAARLTGWDIDIMTPETYEKNLETLSSVVKSVAGVDDVLVDKLVAMGCTSCRDVDEIGEQPLIESLEITPELALAVAEACGEEVIRAEEEKEAAAKAAAAARLAGLTTVGAAAVSAVAGNGADTSAFISDEVEAKSGEAAGFSAEDGEASARAVAVITDGDDPVMMQDGDSSNSQRDAAISTGPGAINDSDPVMNDVRADMTDDEIENRLPPDASLSPSHGPGAPSIGAGAETVAGDVPEISDAQELGLSQESAAVMSLPSSEPDVFPPLDPPDGPADPTGEDRDSLN